MAFNKEAVAVPIIGFVLIIIVVSFFVSIFSHMAQPTITIRLGDGIFKAKVASTEQQRQKGLADVDRLESSEALLMVFPDQGKWSIWMKDMKVPIDVVWLDFNKKVIYSVANISPEISDLETYAPKTLAKYVVELPAGTIKSKAINNNSVADFDLGTIVGFK